MSKMQRVLLWAWYWYGETVPSQDPIVALLGPVADVTGRTLENLYNDPAVNTGLKDAPLAFWDRLRVDYQRARRMNVPFYVYLMDIAADYDLTVPGREEDTHGVVH